MHITGSLTPSEKVMEYFRSHPSPWTLKSQMIYIQVLLTRFSVGPTRRLKSSEQILRRRSLGIFILVEGNSNRQNMCVLLKYFYLFIYRTNGSAEVVYHVWSMYVNTTNYGPSLRGSVRLRK